jgi:hypothetical protein
MTTPVLRAHAEQQFADEIAALQKRIDSKGLLFKVRVVSAQVGGHEAPATVPQKGMDTL